MVTIGGSLSEANTNLQMDLKYCMLVIVIVYIITEKLHVNREQWS